MDIYTVLKSDHKKANRIFEKLVSSKELKKRKKYFEQLTLILLAHTKAEEKTFYHFLSNKNEMKEMIMHAEEEHTKVENELFEIKTLIDQEKPWINRLKKVMKAVNHHIGEEEGPIFENAKKVINQAQAKSLAEKMKGMEEKLMHAKNIA